ncbi:maleylpyruvate isomerase family mycothiol-dependent enzyme [Catenuloplanes japonicus]|uniref:maleylpyruvate isomerase family mycothiol-dependent enzyme n=1 Tax=Catenuloplanes japonicus TaxID=33876 RepID=UPI00068B0F5D|nr:maleylpyruvate isomerase family mycothiol-dependent enzyme [Catenuloplanes japonicus]
MRTERFEECLAADAARLREAVAGNPAAPVPTCPGWTVTDLAEHVTNVYRHKTEIMRSGAFPEDWSPTPETGDPLAGFDRAYAELAGELAARDPEESVPSWYPADQTVGFWARRMAHETVIHRVDGELAAGLPRAPIPADLAVDGVDEVLVRFLEHGSRHWPDDFGDALTPLDGRAVRVTTTAGGSWLVLLTPDGVTVTTDDAGEAAATVTGDPETVLLWLWRRGGPDGLTFGGDTALVDVLHELMAKPTL